MGVASEGGGLRADLLKCTVGDEELEREVKAFLSLPPAGAAREPPRVHHTTCHAKYKGLCQDQRFVLQAHRGVQNFHKHVAGKGV